MSRKFNWGSSAHEGLDRLWFGALLLYTVSLPLFFFSSTGLTVLGWKNVLVVDVVFAILVATFGMWALCTPGFRLKGLILADSAFLLFGITLPIMFSPEPSQGLPDLYRVGYSVVLYFVAAHFRYDLQRLRVISWVWIGAAALLALLSFLALLRYTVAGTPSSLLSIMGVPTYTGNLAVRLQGTFGNPNTFAPYLNSALVFGLILLLLEGTSWFGKLLTAILAAAILSAGILTSSRGVVGIVFTVGLVSLATIPPTRAGRAARYLIVSILLGSALVVTAVSIWWVYPVRVVVHPEVGELTLTLNSDRSPYYLYHRGAIRMFLDHPLTGIGPGRFNQNFREYLSWEEAYRSWRWFSDPHGAWERYVGGSDPHSTWLGWLAKGGVVGMFFLIGFLARVFSRLVRNALPISRVPFVFMAGLAGFVLIGFYVEIIHLRFFWLMLGIAMGWVTRSVALTPERTGGIG